MYLTTGKLLVTAFFEVYNTKQYHDLRACMADNYFDHSLSFVQSLADAIEVLESTHRAFPDLSVVIDDLIEEADRVVFRGRFSGTQLGDFMGISPTGLRVQFEAIEIFRIKDCKISESWGYWPAADISRQLQATVNRV